MNKSLLDFFNERNTTLKSIVGLAQSVHNSKSVANYNFLVSNYKTDEHNTIEFSDINILEKAVSDYYYDTDVNVKDKIIYAEYLNDSKQMYVHLILP